MESLCSDHSRRCIRGLAAGFAAATVSLGLAHGAVALDVQVMPNTAQVIPYQVFELTFQHSSTYRSPTWDVVIDVTLTSPCGKHITVGGFFYGSSQPQEPKISEGKDNQGRVRTTAVWPCNPADVWKARYAPSELGEWSYRWVFRNNRDERAAGQGRFRVVKGRAHPHGWLRINPCNPFRFVFEDGSPYYPVGFQDGVFDNNHNGSAMDAGSMEGPFRPDVEGNRPRPPPGALFARGPAMNPQNYDVLLGRHARAGFNLWRFSPHNFSLDVFSLDDVKWEEARMVDEMLCLTRKYGIRTFYGIFGFMKVFNDDPNNEAGMAKVKRLVKYSVDRWGAYVDFWEILNEQKASAEWYAIILPYLKSVDPYHKPIATSWERPDVDGIDISAPHWYGREDELVSDHITASNARRHKEPGKPVVYGEQGNGGGKPELIPQGIGGVWDPGSARRMRVRLWTAFFQETSLIFWETSYAKDGHHMNIWLGMEERQYVHVLQDFAHRLDPAVAIAHVAVEGPQAQQVRAYGLRSGGRAAVYLHHFACAQCARSHEAGAVPAHHRWDHERGEVKSLAVTLDVPQTARGYWYSPLDARIFARVDVRAGLQSLPAPPFSVDLALLITEESPPDIDRDGQPNDEDIDDDNDGVSDLNDAAPLEREEWSDVDRDRIGDNLDADTDGDGIADDRNRNGVPDHEEPDWDGDGIPNANAIPWDAFPRDPKEWRDTDGDSIGDNADPDADGDGYSNAEERKANTDPLNPLSFPPEQ